MLPEFLNPNKKVLKFESEFLDVKPIIYSRKSDRQMAAEPADILRIRISLHRVGSVLSAFSNALYPLNVLKVTSM